MKTKSSYGGVDVYFHLPLWTGLAGVGPTHNNSFQRALASLADVKETCLDHQCWVKVTFGCAPALLPKRIKDWQAKLDRFLLRWSKTKQIRETIKS